MQLLFWISLFLDIRHLSSHEALYLLKHSLATPNLQYVLRTSPAFSSSELDNYDRILFDAIENINNIMLVLSSLTQACLPVRWGGLGIRSAVALAPCAFLASIFASQALVNQILPICFSRGDDPLITGAIECWQRLGGAQPPSHLPRILSETGTILYERLLSITLSCPLTLWAEHVCLHQPPTVLVSGYMHFHRRRWG